MSTKTSIKRIALVAVSALGFGLLSVVPARAAAGDITMTYDFTSTGATATPVVGTAVVVPITLATSAITSDASGATATLTAELTTLPTNTALDAQGATTASVSLNEFPAAEATMAATASTSTVGAKLTATYVGDDLTQAATAVGSFGFTPDVPGYYVMTLTVSDTNADAGGANTSAITTATIEITVEGAQLVQAFSGLGANSGTQVAGRNFAAAYTFAAATTTTGRFVITASGANITSVNNVATATNVANATSSTTTAGVTKVNGTDFKDGANFANQVASQTGVSGSGVSEGLLISANATDAGTAYIYIKSINSTTGVLTTVETITVTITTAANSAISAANSTIGLQSAACPTFGANKAADVAALANAAPADLTAAAGGILHVCIKTRDGNGNAIAVTAASQITTSLGYIGTTSTPSSSSVAAAAANSQDMYLLGVSTMKGAGTVTATLIDGAGNAITLSAPVTFYGTLATLELAANSSWSAQPYADGYATSAPTTAALTLLAKDANGKQIDLSQSANSTGSYTVESSGTAGTAANRSSDSLGATVASSFASADIFTYGTGNWVAVSCAASTGPEKLTITAWGKDSLGAWVASNSVDYYCSSSTVASLELKPASTALTVGGTTTLDFVAKDASGFIVPDGTAVAWGTTFGSVVAASTTTLNGSLLRDAVFTAPSTNGKAVVTVTVGTRGFNDTETITVGTGVDNSTAAAEAASDAAAEAIDAANAATDAANLAAEAADAATVAAEEARDAADAATAAVEELATQVATLMAALKAQITTLANTVAKIAKKVKA